MFSPREEIMELLYEPTCEIIEKLEQQKEKLDYEEMMLLEKLKYSVGIFALKRAMKRNDGNGFQKSSENI